MESTIKRERLAAEVPEQINQGFGRVAGGLKFEKDEFAIVYVSTRNGIIRDSDN